MVIGYSYEVEAKVILVVGLFVGDEEGPGDGRYRLSGSRSSIR